LPDIVGVGQYALDAATVRWLHKKLYLLVEEANPGKICLDAGCGVGSYFSLLGTAYEKIVGVDFSKQCWKDAG